MTDKNGCTLKKEVTVSEPTALTASLSSTAVLCKGEKTGSATVVASEGTSPYSYVWSDGQTTATASNLAAGSYTVVVTDKNGCTLKKEVTVSEPTALTASLSSTAVLCKGEKTGSATVVASEGTSPYSYVWSDGQTTATASNLAAGSYTVVVTDKNGCTLKKEVTVSEPTALTASLSSTAVLCKGEKTGSATVVASEGTSPYSYVWSEGQTTATASNLAAGNYTVVVTDKNGCTLKKEVTVSEPTALTASLSSTAVLCKGEKTGSATVVASEGTSPYSYVWNDTANQTTATASNLAAGNYTVVVTDKNGCTLKKEVTVSEPTALTASLSSTAVLCKGEKTGSATVVASEGTSPYSYVWNDTANQTTATASNLAAGNYTVVVTDKNGCTLKKEVTVSEPTALTASLSSTAVLCKGEKTGSATVVASEGTSPYSYVWSEGQTTATASNLAAGNYTVVVTDKNGCTLKKEVTVSEPTALTASLSSTAVLCKGEKTGSATVVASEGTSPYSYVWSDGQTTATASNLAAGSYTVVVTDKNGCTLKKEVTVSEPTALTASLSSTAVLCKGEKTGSATVVASEGTSPYSYVWNDTANQTTATASNLAAGSYTVVVTDKNGCTLKKEVTVSEPTALTASLSSTAVLCKGEKTGSATVVASEGTSPYSYVWSDGQTTATASNLAAGSYTVVVTDKNGCTLKKEVTVSEPTALTASLSSTAVLCKGEKTGSATVVASEGTSPYSYVWSDGQTTATASNLAAGSYTVVVTDKNGCTLKKEVTVSEPTALTASLSSTAVLCKGEKTGSATVVASEGTSPYSYVWSDGQTTATASNLAAGNYTVVVTDKNGCTLKKEVTVSEPTALTASLSSTAVLCKGEKTGSATVVASEGTSPYSYVWSDGQTTATASNLAAGNYTVVVTDKNGCTLKKEVTVSEPTALTASLSSTAVLCKGEKSGSATVVASEGTSPYSYVWSEGQTTATASNLAAGNYTVVVTDKNGCTLKKEVTVSEPTALTASLSSTAVLCKGEKTGSATVVASEGTSPYSYVWSEGQTTATASNLAAGNYTVVVTDKNGCTLKKEVTVSEPTALTASLSSTAVLCKGEKTGSATVVASEGTSPYSYVWSDGQTTATASNLAAGSYTVVVTDKNGCTLKKEVTIKEPEKLLLTGITTNPSCSGATSGSINLTVSGGFNGYSYSIDGQSFQSASSFTNLSEGTYTFTVKDANNCIATTTITLIQPNSVPSPTILGNITLCAGQQIPTDKISIESGNTLVWHASNNSSQVIGGPNASQIGSNIYYVSQQTNSGCESTLVPVNITILDANLTIIGQPSSNSICKNESATLSISTSGNVESYQWQKNGVNISGANSPTYIINLATDSDTGDYTCVVNGGCSTIISSIATLRVKDCNGNGNGNGGGCVDLALRKRLICDPKTPVYKPNDLVKFEITVFNQCKIKNNTAYNINIVDYIPKGLVLDTTNSHSLTWERSIDTLRTLDNRSIIRIDSNAVTCIDSLAGGDSTTVSIMLRVKPTTMAGVQINKAEIFGADLDKYNRNHIIADVDSRFDKNPINDIGGRELSPTDDYIWGNGDGFYDIVGGVIPKYDEDDEDPTLINIVTPKDTCLDLALRKRLVCNPAVKPLYMPNDLVKFEITVFNQCKTGKAYNIDIVDYVPKDMILEKTTTTNQKWFTSTDTLRALYTNEVIRIDTNAVTCIDSLASGDSTTIEITLRIKDIAKQGVKVNKAEIFGADLDKECKSHFTHDIDSCFDKNPMNDPGGKELSPTDDDILGNGDIRYDIVGGIIPQYDEDDEDPSLIVVGSIDCLDITTISVKGNKWHDLYDENGRLFASINPNGQDLGTVVFNVHHYGNGEKNIPSTQNGTKLMSRYFALTSSVEDSFETAVSLRLYYLNSELEDYKAATKLPSLTMKDFNIVRYNGDKENCQFEDNDNIIKGLSDVLYKDIKSDTMNCNAFYLQFNVNQLTELGATANKYTTLSFDAVTREDKKTVSVTWKPTLEVSANYYILERGQDCKNFTLMSKILAKGINTTYEVIDSLPLIGANCYRLTYVDKDGTRKILDPKSIIIDSTSSRKPTTIDKKQVVMEEKPTCTIYPNPVENYSEINLAISNITADEINLYNINGQEIKMDILSKAPNKYQIIPSIDIKEIYFVVIRELNGKKKCVVRIIGK